MESFLAVDFQLLLRVKYKNRSWHVVTPPLVTVDHPTRSLRLTSKLKNETRPVGFPYENVDALEFPTNFNLLQSKNFNIFKSRTNKNLVILVVVLHFRYLFRGSSQHKKTQEFNIELWVTQHHGMNTWQLCGRYGIRIN